MNTTVWRFEALDTLFFRDGRPMNAGESAWVDSIFPPGGQTLQGAIRAAILDYLNVDIDAFQNVKLESLNQEIGDRSSLGAMKLSGISLQKDEELLFPVPLDLVKNENHEFAMLRPDQVLTECDLGKVRLPAAEGAGFKPMEQTFIGHEAMENVLAGDLSTLRNSHLFPLFAESGAKIDGLCDREYKVGLARNNQTRTAMEGMLFAIAPVRPREGVSIAVQVDGVGIDRQPKGQFVQKLGGEGKLALVNVSPSKLELPGPPVLKSVDGRIRFKLVLTSPALIPDGRWLPNGFLEMKDQQSRVHWSGKIDEIDVDIVSACIGKPVKIGGWNLAKPQPEPVRAFIPAGSVYFCEANESDGERPENLHGRKLGEKREYGYGHILLGTW